MSDDPTPTVRVLLCGQPGIPALRAAQRVRAKYPRATFVIVATDMDWLEVAKGVSNTAEVVVYMANQSHPLEQRDELAYLRACGEQHITQVLMVGQTNADAERVAIWFELPIHRIGLDIGAL